MNRTRSAALAVFMLSLVAAGQTAWTGGAGTSDWGNPANWNPAAVPTSTTDVVIPSGTPTSPSTAGVIAETRLFNLQAGATLTIATGSPLSTASTTTINGTLVGTERLRLIGGGTLSASQPIPALEVAATGQVQMIAPITITGDLSVLSGTTGPGGAGAVAVGGDATFSGGTLTFFTGADVDVAGDVLFNGTTSSFLPRFRCAGNWISDAGVSTGSNFIVFDGTTPQTFTPAGSTLNDIDVDPGADVTLTTPLDCDSLDIDGTFRCAAPLDLSQGFTVGGGGALDLGGLTNSIGGAVNITGTLLNPGTLLLDGTGAVSSSAALGDVTVSGTNVSFSAPLTISGDLLLTAGQLAPSGAGSITIGGTATFSGGTLTFFSGAVIDVTGDITFNGTTSTFSPNFRCRGNWSSDASYFSNSSTVVFDGAGPQTVTSAPGSRINRVEIVAGADVTAQTSFTVRTAVIVDGDLALATAADIDGGVTVNATGTLDFGAFPCSIGGPLSVTGSLANIGPITFDGAGAIDSGGHVLDDVTLAGTGSKTFTAPFAIGGDLLLTGGTMGTSGTGAVTIAGNATFSGGTMTFFTSAFLDVAGDVTFNGAGVTAPPTIECAGAWTSDAGFNASFSIVRLDGAGAQTFSAPGSTFNRMEIAASSTVTSSNGLHCRGRLDVDGQLFAASPTDLDHELAIDGSLVATASMDVERTCTVTAGATLDLGGIAHSFGGGFDIDGSLLNPALVTFDNTGGTVALVPGNALDDVVVATSGFLTMTAPIAINGDLDQTSGTIATAGPAGSAITVAGNATFSGGSLTFIAAREIDVAGDVTFNGTAASSPPPIRCRGAWSSDAGFDSTFNTVFFDGVGSQAFTAPGSSFNRVEIAPQSVIMAGGAVHCRGQVLIDGRLTAAGPLDLDNALTVNGILDALAPMDVEGNVVVAAAGSLMAGMLTHDFGGNVTLDGLYVHSGVMRLDGNGAVSSPGGSTLPDVVVANATSQVSLLAPLTVTGDLGKSGTGMFLVGGTGNVDVAGNATFSDGSISFLNPAVLDIVGDVTFNGCAATSPPIIRCGGSWTSDAGFDATFGTVILAGVGAQSFDHAGSTFNGLMVEAGANVSSTTPLTCRFLVDIDGSLTCGAPLHTMNSLQVDGVLTSTSTCDFDGAVTVSSTGNLDLGAGAHTVGSAFDIQGGLVVSSVLEFDGSGQVTVPGTPLPGVRVNASGVVTIQTPLTIAGDLDGDGGFITIGGAVDVVVTGDMDLDGIDVSTGSLGFDVDGDVTIRNVPSMASLVVRCAGDFRADSTFAPTSGVIHLDGPTPTTFGAIGGTTLAVAQLRMANARRTPESSLSLAVSGSVIVEPSGTLALAGRDLDVAGGTIQVDGLMDLVAGDQLALDSQAGVLVNAAGALSMNGAVANPVRVIGLAGGGYDFSIGGALSAMNFEFQEVGPQGVTITATATIAAPPYDFRGGLFDNPTPGPGSRLLMVDQPTGTELQFLTFENSNGLGTFNARPGTGTVTMRNFGGAFSGPAFEDDPLSRLNWGGANVTTVSSFDLRPLGQRVRARFTTATEVNAVRFDLERAVSAMGPYTVAASFTPQGAGTEYAFEDAPLVGGQMYFYRLVEELTHGAMQTFASATATPLAVTPPANFLTVGPGGAFGDIQSAVNAATDPQSVVLVEAGTYPAFSVNGAVVDDLRILAEAGQIVTIDTTTGPVAISNLPIDAAVELDGLVIGSASSPSGAVTVSGCAGTVLITDCDVAGGVAMPGAAIDSSTAVAVQGCMVAGTPAVRADVGSRAIVGDTVLSTLEIRGVSTVTTSGAVPGAVVVDPGSTHDALPGTRPRIGVPDLVTLGDPFTATVEVDPFQLWILFFTTRTRWFDFGSPAVEVGALVDPINVGISLVAMRHADATGMDSELLQVTQLPGLLGVKGVFQAATYESSLSRYRWSNAATTNIVP